MLTGISTDEGVAPGERLWALGIDATGWGRSEATDSASPPRGPPIVQLFAADTRSGPTQPPHARPSFPDHRFRAHRRILGRRRGGGRPGLVCCRGRALLVETDSVLPRAIVRDGIARARRTIRCRRRSPPKKIALARPDEVFPLRLPGPVVVQLDTEATAAGLRREDVIREACERWIERQARKKIV
jgi:hypothetical protein